MSSWLKIKGTQTGELGLGFDGPVLKNDSGNLILRNAANTANVSITAANITTTAVFFGNGSGLTNIPGANVTGQVGNALVAGTVYEAAQPNITSVGTLSSVSVSGNAAVGGILTDNYYYANGAPVDFQQAAGSNTQVQFNDNNDFGASANFTFNTATDTLFATNVTGNGAGLTSLTGANVTGTVANAAYANDAGNATVAITVSNASQPNITSVGTLSSLVVSGNATVNGDLLVNGNLTYINVSELVVEDPMIQLGGGPNGAPLTSDDGKDRGLQLHYYTTEPVDAFMGWDNSNAEFAFGSNVSITDNQVVTFNELGNVRAAYFIGNGSALTSLTGANVTGTVANAQYANIAGEAYSVAGANVSGQVGNALVAGTVYTNAQPNITSLGTLANLTVNGLVDLGNVGNVAIAGGSAGFILTTDGAGNLTFVAPVSGASAWKVDSTTIAFGAGATTTAMTLPANAIVDRVSVIVDTPFNGTAPTMSVGLQGGTGFEYAEAGDINLLVGDRYDIPSQLAAVGSSQTIDILYSADGSSAGSARVLVTYAIPE
jgi:hypothetical protein